MMLNKASTKTPSVGVCADQNCTALWFNHLKLSLIIFIFFTTAMEAQGSKIFTVSGVHVDVTSSSSADARTKALGDGQLQAFERILRRLVISHQVGRLPRMKLEEINEYVRDFAVDNERNSPIRYLADLTFRFKPRKIRNLLRDLEIEFAETVSKPVLVLPIYEVAAAKSLWDSPNPWREAWGQLNLLGGLVPLRLPSGDLKDVGTIGAEQAVAGDEPRIQAIGARYNVDTIMVAYAVLASGPQGRPSVRVNVISYGTDQRASTVENEYLAKSDEIISDLLKRAASSSKNTVEDRWKEDNLIKFEQDSVLSAAVPIESLQDWVEVKCRLDNVAVIESIDLVLISRDEANINVFYLGGDEQLSLALAQADMKLEKKEGNWILRFQQQNKCHNSLRTK